MNIIIVTITSALLADVADGKPAPIAIADVRRSTTVDFTDEIAPIFRANCLACHNGKEAESGLILETPQSIVKGGDEGPVVAPGNGAESKLLKLASHQVEPVMPPADNKVGAKPLTPEQLGLIKLWIDQGARGEAAAIARVVPRQPLAAGLQPILTTAITPDDEYVACNRGQKLFAYHLPGMRLAAELCDPALAAQGQPATAHEDLIRSLAFNRSGDLLASGGFRTVKLWRRPKSKLQREIATAQTPTSLAVSPDGRLLAVGLPTGAIDLHDLPAAQTMRLLAGHEGTVNGLAFSPDGATLYSASADKTVRARRVATGELSGKLMLAVEPRRLAVIGAGALLATADADHAIRLWNTADVKTEPAAAPPAAVRELKAHSRPLTALIALPTGDRLLSASEDNRMLLWNASTGETVRGFDHEGPIASAAVSPDGGRAVSAGANGVARLWKLDDGARLAEIKTDPQSAKALVRADAALNYARACVEYRKEEHRESEEVLKRETATVESAQKAKEQAEKTVAEKTANAQKAAEAQTAAEQAAKPVAEALKVATDKKDTAQTAATVAEKAVNQATNDLNKAREAAATDSQNKDLAAARDAAEEALTDARQKKQAADAALNDANAALRDAMQRNEVAQRAARDAAEKAKQPQRELQEAKDVLQGAINFIPTAMAVLERAKAAVPVAQQKVTEAEAVVARRDADKKSAEAAQNQTKPLHAVVFSSDGSRFILAGESTGLRVYDAENGAPLETLDATGAANALAFAADGKLISAGNEPRVVVWQTESQWTLVRAIGRPDDPDQLIDRVLSLDFSPDGTLLATGGGLLSRSGQLKIFRVADGQLVSEIPAAHRDTIHGVRFSPDGQLLATASADRLIKLFRVADGSLVRTFEGHTHHVLGIAWQSGGKLLASCGGDQTVKLWDVETGLAMCTMRGDTYRLGEYRREVTSISFIGDTEHMVTSSGDRSVRMHRTSSVRDVRAFREGASFMHAAVATSDGKLVIGGGRDGVLHIWNGESGYPVLSFEPPK